VNFRRALLLLRLAALVLAGCASRTAAPPSPGLSGTKWRLGELAGLRAIPGVEATLEFLEEGKVAGRASCNRFLGTVEISGESIKFGPLASTKMACVDDAANAQERKYLEALQAAERFAFEGPVLLVYSRATDRPLRFARR
jgi:heat shock protein HslJ